MYLSVRMYCLHKYINVFEKKQCQTKDIKRLKNVEMGPEI